MRSSAGATVRNEPNTTMRSPASAATAARYDIGRNRLDCSRRHCTGTRAAMRQFAAPARGACRGRRRPRRRTIAQRARRCPRRPCRRARRRPRSCDRASVAQRAAQRAPCAAAGLWATSRIHSIGRARRTTWNRPGNVTRRSPRSIASRDTGNRLDNASSALSTAAALSNCISPRSAGSGRSR